MIRADYALPAATQTLRASRLAFLEILIAAGWGDTPQNRIPADVIADAEQGIEPRRCGALRAEWPRVRDEGRTAHRLVRRLRW